MTGFGAETVEAAAIAGPGIGSWWRHAHHIVPIGFVGAISWSVWLVRFTLSRLYRPVPNGFVTTTSVVVPSFREDPDILEQCLVTWLAENPSEVIVVPDLADTEVIARLYSFAAMDRRLQVVPFAHRGKRSALGVGIRQARGEILVLSDSDTRWRRGLLRRGAGPVRRPPGRRGRNPAERLPSGHQRVAAGRRLDDRHPVPRLRPRPVPARRGSLPLRPDGGLPAGGGAAGGREPGRRVLPRAALRRGR